MHRDTSSSHTRAEHDSTGPIPIQKYRGEQRYAYYEYSAQMHLANPSRRKEVRADRSGGYDCEEGQQLHRHHHSRHQQLQMRAATSELIQNKLIQPMPIVSTTAARLCAPSVTQSSKQCLVRAESSFASNDWCAYSPAREPGRTWLCRKSSSSIEEARGRQAYLVPHHHRKLSIRHDRQRNAMLRRCSASARRFHRPRLSGSPSESGRFLDHAPFLLQATDLVNLRMKPMRN
mmetsp:Transcript_14591/g.40243  ORF Transcript_14591/g.40243 Transcript_14591/m.40243 type:complete len:232 (-) Transcript_14591:560-1255(-)